MPMSKTAWNTLIKTLLLLGINTIIQAVWVAMEMAVYGEPRPSGIDTIVGITLALSLYINLRHHIRIGGE